MSELMKQIHSFLLFNLTPIQSLEMGECCFPSP